MAILATMQNSKKNTTSWDFARQNVPVKAHQDTHDFLMSVLQNAYVNHHIHRTMARR
jgi:hypothetical protein